MERNETMNPLDLTKPVQTRNGKPARIICTDVKSGQPILALVKCPDRTEAVISYSIDGSFFPDDRTSDNDLINVPNKKTFEFWVNLYPTSVGEHTFTSLKQAKLYATPNIFARKKIIIEVEEGEGL